MAALAALGGETWFGSATATSPRTWSGNERLAAGESLSAVTADFCRRLGIATRVVPMSDDAVRTRLRTDEAGSDFQDYFCGDAASRRSRNWPMRARLARVHADVIAALRDTRLRAVVIAVESVRQHRADAGRSRDAR